MNATNSNKLYVSKKRYRNGEEVWNTGKHIYVNVIGCTHI